MVKFKTDIRTVTRMQSMMDDWMSAHGEKIELELSTSRSMKRLGDFVLAFDLEYLDRELNSNALVICELGGRAPTKKALIYRFVCCFEGSEDDRPIIMDVEEKIYDEACRTGRWEVLATKIGPAVRIHV
ncbi:MAG TPA: hypothetical protein EYQ54_07030 [Myxococcales bacterium]|jgi:hypothetical protein|nr:hypothetical protein [Myxococcales bacterium]HIL01104.1 hypothetical protein [Myxococcales bacterium]